MAKRYLGFAVCIKEQEKGIFFKRTEKEEVFSRITVGDVENFAEAQELLCRKMNQYKMSVAILFPYCEKEEEK